MLNYCNYKRNVKIKVNYYDPRVYNDICKLTPKLDNSTEIEIESISW